MSPLEVIACEHNGGALSYSYKLPNLREPALLEIGAAPTPISVAASCANERSIALFLYQGSADLRLAHIDKATGEADEHVLHGMTLTYQPVYDRFDPDVLWIPTCLEAALVRFDHKSGRFEPITKPDGATHIFGLDQHSDGSLYLGTFPNRACLRVRFDQGRSVVEEIQVNEPAVALCRYLHGVFAADEALFLHYMSPGILVRYELASGKTEVLMKTDRAGLNFNIKGQFLEVSNGSETVVYDRAGRLRPPEDFPNSPAFRVKSLLDTARITWKGGEASISLIPRDAGMRVTALAATPDGRLYGGTYWNHWLFRIDPAARRVDGLTLRSGLSVMPGQQFIDTIDLVIGDA